MLNYLFIDPAVKIFRAKRLSVNDRYFWRAISYFKFIVPKEITTRHHYIANKNLFSEIITHLT